MTQDTSLALWLDDVIERGKQIILEHFKETFKRYRAMGKLILESGYRKGQWDSEHRERAMKEWGISQQTFSKMVRLGGLSEIEFTTASSNFSSVYKWAQRGSLAKKAKRKREIQILEKAVKFLPPPQKKYDVIVVDPPWPYGTPYNPDTRRVGSPYPEMSLDEIKNIDLPITENCVLWLWTTNAFMRDAYDILESWGFEPKTILTWAKNKFGVGYWLRGQTEHCILAVKGTPTYNNEVAARYSTLLMADVHAHSEKPKEFYELVDAVCLGWKLDYFARKKRKGWETYGTEELETQIPPKENL